MRVIDSTSIRTQHQNKRVIKRYKSKGVGTIPNAKRIKHLVALVLVLRLCLTKILRIQRDKKHAEFTG